MTSIGIHDLQLATGHHVLALADLAAARGVEPDKFRLGLGQDEMSVLAPDDDIVTMGAEAAWRILERHGRDGIRTLIFATESGVDQSKAAGVWAHRLLGLSPDVRVVEFKQACYGGTAALQAAIGIVARAPEERVLIIASDVAKYDLASPGEPTQGAGAVAMLIASDPAIMEIEPACGIHTADVDDFWRPNDSSTAIVEGKLSITAYLDALLGSWDDLARRSGPAIGEIDRLAYHQPFTKMATKAQRALAERLGVELGEEMIQTGSIYNRRLGNSYTASLFAAVAALLDRDADDLAGRRIAMFSYGSGSVSELITAIVQPGYRDALEPERVLAMLDAREPLDVPAYEDLHRRVLASHEDHDTPRVTSRPFRFAGIRGRARRYEPTAG